MKQVLLIILMMYTSNYLYSQSEYIDLEVEITSYLLHDLVEKEDVSLGFSMPIFKRVLLLDSLQNQLAEKSFWSNGVSSWNERIKFKEIKHFDWYVIKYGVFDELSNVKTVSMGNEISIKHNEYETIDVLKNEVFLDKMHNGDSLIISFFEMGKKEIKLVILKKGNQFSIKRIETKKDTPIIYLKQELTDFDIKIIRAFEYDSFRKFRTSCADIGYDYEIKFKEHTRKVRDSCGEWGGYYFLKGSIFNE